MQDTKFWLDSTTVRGALVTVLPAIALILKAFDIDIGEGERENIVDGIAALAGLIGAALFVVLLVLLVQWVIGSGVAAA
jgi:hypothetical protein